MRLTEEVDRQHEKSGSTIIFNGKNYGVWAAQMKARLMKKKLKRMMMKDQIERQDYETEEAYKARVTDDVKETDEDIGMIALYVGKDYVEETVGSNSAFEAWKKLKDIYEGNSTGELFVNRSRFTKISMKEGQSITSYISKLEKLQQLCDGSEAKITEKEMVMKTLHSLTPEWDTYCEGLEAREDVLKSFSLLKTLLIKKSVLKGHQEDDLETEENEEKKKAFKTFKKSELKKRFNGECFNCGKKGHKKSDCWSSRNGSNYEKQAKLAAFTSSISKIKEKQYKKDKNNG